MYGSIDLVTDKIERQIRKNKTKSNVRIKVKLRQVNSLQML